MKLTRFTIKDLKEANLSFAQAQLEKATRQYEEALAQETMYVGRIARLKSSAGLSKGWRYDLQEAQRKHEQHVGEREQAEAHVGMYQKRVTRLLQELGPMREAAEREAQAAPRGIFALFPFNLLNRA